MRTSRRIATVVLLFAMFVVLDVALTYALVPYGSKSEVVWHEYHTQEGIDSVIVGNSIALTGVDPFVLDDELGTNCLNLSSPSQRCEETYVALKEVFSQRDVKTVYFCTEFVMFVGKSDSGPHKSFLFEKWRYDNPAVIFEDFLDVTRVRSWLGKAESINWLFPWVTNHVPYDVGKVIDNIRMRLDGTPIEVAAEANENGYIYKGRGFGTVDAVADFNDSHPYYSSILGKTKQASQDKLKVLQRICALCEENGAKLVVVIAPMPTYCLYEISPQYESFSASLQDCLAENGVEYYDFNLAKPDLFDNKDELFRDYQHLNTVGADIFTRALAQLLLEKEAGADVDGLFMTFQERLDSTSTVQSVDISVNVEADDVALSAASYAKKGVNAEYRFAYQREGDEGWTEIREYSPEAACTFVPEGRGTYTFRVYARAVGSEGEYDCYYSKTVVA